ncbi:MAG: lipoyl synthase [Phycisphaerales bacterium]|jgi:lipoic acid synthetase|nr:lipoyl synthase [Phycisphaerales bacterium]
MPRMPHPPAAIDRHPRPLGGDTARFGAGEVVLSLSDRVLDNVETRTLAVPRKPSWIRARVPGGESYGTLKKRLSDLGLNTVCQEASCPNIGECWGRGVATIMILGDTCTRACGFCNVKTGRPPVTDLEEPDRVARMLAESGLRHVVVTSVDRDDLPDGGAAIWADTISRSRASCPGMSIEALVGDFKGNRVDMQVVIDAAPDILAHNVETVERMHPAVRPQADYERSIEVLAHIKQAGLTSKTSLMVGIGERDDEVVSTMNDIRQRAGTDILTIGQYLQPTRNHLPVDRWIPPATFTAWKDAGLQMGFRVVESGPLVRSSYHADAQATAAACNR